MSLNCDDSHSNISLKCEENRVIIMSLNCEENPGNISLDCDEI